MQCPTFFSFLPGHNGVQALRAVSSGCKCPPRVFPGPSVGRKKLWMSALRMGPSFDFVRKSKRRVRDVCSKTNDVRQDRRTCGLLGTARSKLRSYLRCLCRHPRRRPRRGRRNVPTLRRLRDPGYTQKRRYCPCLLCACRTDSRFELVVEQTCCALARVPTVTSNAPDARSVSPTAAVGAHPLTKA